MSESQSQRLKLRYGAYSEGDREEIVVKVTLADFNGQSFDGRPFSAIPTWLEAAMKAEVVSLNYSGGRDYAEWNVKCHDGVVIAGQEI